MVGHVEMHYPATVIAENNEYKQDFEAGSWNGQEIE